MPWDFFRQQRARSFSVRRSRSTKLVLTILCWLAVPGAETFAQSKDVDLIPPKVDTTMAWNVSAADGNLKIDSVDIGIGDFQLERFSQGYPGRTTTITIPEDTAFGFRMSHNFDIYVMPSRQPPTKLFIGYDGQQYHYTTAYYFTTVHLGRGASGTYYQSSPTATPTPTDPEAWAGILTMSGGAYVYTDKLGDTYTFNPSVHVGGTLYGHQYSQKVDHIGFANGRTQTFSYDSSSRLKYVYDSRGFALIFDYDANGNAQDACIVDLARSYVTASSTCSGQTIRATYTYNVLYSNLMALSSATDATGRTTGYTAEPNFGDFICVKPPGYSNCQASFASGGGGGTETLADGTTWNVGAGDGEAAYVPGDDTYAPPGNCGTQGSATDSMGKTTTFTMTKSSPCSVTDANNRTTNYYWLGGGNFVASPDGLPPSNDGSLLLEADFPEGNKYFASYSSGNFNAILQERYVAKPNSGLADRVVNYTYPSVNSGVSAAQLAKPLSRTDPNGNETDWTYANWGGVLSEMQPAPIAGAARPLKLYTYVGKSAYILTSGGTLASTGQPIWLPATEVQCQTVAGSSSPTCDPAAPIVTTTYQYGADGTADNLLLHGKAVSDGTTTLRTCYGYDVYSHKISETSPRAGLSTCP